MLNRTVDCNAHQIRCIENALQASSCSMFGKFDASSQENHVPGSLILNP